MPNAGQEVTKAVGKVVQRGKQGGEGDRQEVEEG